MTYRVGIMTAVSVAALAAAIHTRPADAQAADGIEDITVTALRSSERLQDVPAAVSVFNADTLENARIEKLNDLTGVVPNFSILQSFRPGVATITLRGIPTAQGGEAPVAIIIDGAQVPSLDFFSQDLVDIRSIQVLRGPQGAIYGRGAIAGAILIDTKQPNNEWEGAITGSYGRGPDARVVATVSGAIVPDKLFVRATVADRYFGGLVYDTGLRRGADYAGDLNTHLAVTWLPDELTQIDFRFSRSWGSFGTGYYTVIPNSEITDFSIDPARNIPDRDRRVLGNYVLKGERTLPFGTITSITQWSYTSDSDYEDGDFSTAPIVRVYEPSKVSAINEDLRFSSPVGEPFTWLVGAYYQRRVSPTYLLVDGQPGGPIPGVILALSDDLAISRSWAVYGQASYDLPYDFQIRGALRFDTDHRTDADKQVAGSFVETTFYAFQPSITLSRKITDNINAYFSYGRGFRSGGFNPYNDVLSTGVPRIYPKETTENFEGGIKTSWLAGRLTANASVFHTSFTNQQFFFVNINPPSRDIVTIPATTINGGEIEINYRPIDGLSLVASAGINDTSIDNAGPGALAKYNGNRSPLSYDATLDLSAQYRWALTDSIALLARVDYQHLGEIYYDQTGDFKYPPVDLLGARFGAEWGALAVSVYGKNLTNTRMPTTFNPNSFGPDANGRLANDPVSWGMELKYSF